MKRKMNTLEENILELRSRVYEIHYAETVAEGEPPPKSKPKTMDLEKLNRLARSIREHMADDDLNSDAS